MAVVCYCTRGWAARYFKWGSYVDGKAASNLRKKKKIDSLTSGIFIYYSQFSVSIYLIGASCPWLFDRPWMAVVLHELALLLLYMFIGYQLWPEVHAQYIEVSEDMEKAAAQTLQDLRSDLWVGWEGD